MLHRDADGVQVVAIADTGDLQELRRVDGAAAALARIVHTPEPLDEREARERFAALLAGRLEAAKGPDVGEAQA